MSKKVKVGIFLVGGIALFCVGLFLIGSREQLFAHHFVIYTQFNNVDTLQTGAKVRVSGMDAGEITEIQVPKGPSSEFRLTMKVDNKLHPIIRKDSVASIETEGMVGNKFVNIKKGDANSPECPSGCTLPSQESTSMGDLMREGGKLAKMLESTVGDVHNRADTAIQNITDLAGHADGLIVGVTPKVEKIASNGVGLSGNANDVMAGVRQGHGVAGKLLTDNRAGAEVDQTIANAEQASANAVQASRNVNTMTSQLNHAVGTFLAPGKNNEPTAMALRDAVQGAQQTMTNLADDTEALKTNFFFRGFFNRRGFYNLAVLTPEKYESSEFVKKPKARIWIPAAELFTSRADGSQQLTAAGRSVLDKSMSKLVSYLPDNPVVVEGYAATGLPDQRYLASDQRAIAVRQYLESRFHLDPNRVGIMPLRGRPPAHTGKQTWDGVCLVLVVSK